MSDNRSAEGAMLYGARAIGNYLGLTQKSAEAMIAQRVIPTFRIGRRVAARRATVDEWLAEQERRALEAAD